MGTVLGNSKAGCISGFISGSISVSNLQGKKSDYSGQLCISDSYHNENFKILIGKVPETEADVHQEMLNMTTS